MSREAETFAVSLVHSSANEVGLVASFALGPVTPCWHRRRRIATTASGPPSGEDWMGATGKPTLEEVVREHGSFIRKTLSQLGVDASARPDVEQEVLRGVARGLPAFDPLLGPNPATALRGWLRGICERQAANHHRAERRRGETLHENEELDATPSSAPTAEDELLEAERKALVRQLTGSLAPCQRAVLIAYEIEGVPMRDVAAAQGIPLNTAWNRLRLARSALAAAERRRAACERGGRARRKPRR